MRSRWLTYAFLVIVAIVIALAALIVSEWFARRAGARAYGLE